MDECKPLAAGYDAGSGVEGKAAARAAIAAKLGMKAGAYTRPPFGST